MSAYLYLAALSVYILMAFMLIWEEEGGGGETPFFLGHQMICLVADSISAPQSPNLQGRGDRLGLYNRVKEVTVHPRAAPR